MNVQRFNFIQSSPLIAFEHLGLYLQKHLSQLVAVCGSLRFSRCYMSDASIVLWLAHGNSLNVCVIVLWLAWPKHSPEAPIFHLSANRALLCICYCCFSDPASKLSFANKTRGGAQSQIFGNIFRGRSRWTVDSIGSRKHVVKDAKLVLQLNIFQFTKSEPSPSTNTNPNKNTNTNAKLV